MLTPSAVILTTGVANSDVNPHGCGGSVVQPSVADLVIDALVQSEWQLSERVAALTLQNEQLITLIADLAFDRALFETLARRWLTETHAAHATASGLREEIRRYVVAR